MTPARVLVTAGGAGIGRAVAEAFADDGARVHVCDIDEAALGSLRAARADMGATVADVADEDAVERLFGAALSALGGLDVLVNCAGTAGPTAPAENTDLADWRRCLAVNLDATFLCARRAVPALRAAGGGAIVNMASTAGLFGYPLRTPYAAAKWAIVGFTKSLAGEVGRDGIRFNAICPGSVEGARMDGVIAREAAARGASEATVRESYTRGVSMRCFVSAGDIANMALFLASPAAARISGQAIAVDGHTETYGTGDI